MSLRCCKSWHQTFKPPTSFPGYGNDVVKPHSRVVRTLTTKDCNWGWFWPILFYTFSLRDINLKLGILLSRRHVIWRDSMGVGVSGHSLNQSVRAIFQQSFSVVTPYWWATIIAKQLSKATIPRCLGSFGVVFMSCKVNFQVVRSALHV